MLDFIWSSDLYTLIFILSNLGITIGYVFLAIKILPSTNPKTWQRKWGGAFFFLTCGFTHLFMAMMTIYHVMWHDTLPLWFWLNHIVQFWAVMTYIWGLYIEVVQGDDEDGV